MVAFCTKHRIAVLKNKHMHQIIIIQNYYTAMYRRCSVLPLRWEIVTNIDAVLGSQHTDLFGLTNAAKTFNSCEVFHSGFHIILCGEDILLQWNSVITTTLVLLLKCRYSKGCRYSRNME